MSPKTIQQRAASGAFVGLIGLGINIGQTVAQVPILLHYWTPDTYGRWGTLLAAIGLVTSLDSGHHDFLGNRFCEQWVHSPEKLRHDLASGVRAAVVLALVEIVIACGVLGGGGAAWFGFSPSTGNNGMILASLALYLLYWAIFGAVGGILVKLYPPAGLYALGQWFGIISRLLAFGSLAAAAALGGSIFQAMAAQITVGTAFNLYLFYDLHRRFPELSPWWRGGNSRTSWRNFRGSLILTINGVIDQAATNGLVLVVGRAMNPLSVALFTTVRTVANVGLQGSAIILSPLAPDLVRFHIKKEGQKLISVFATSWLFGSTLLGLGLSLSVFVLTPLYAAWTHGVLPLDRSLFACLGAAVAVKQWGAPFQTYLASLNRLRFQFLMSIARAGLALVIAAILIRPYGLWGAGIGAFLAELVATVISIYAVRHDLKDLCVEFPSRAALFSALQIAASTAVWILFARNAINLIWWTIVAVIGIIVLAWAQWRMIPSSVRSRLLNLVARPQHN